MDVCQMRNSFGCNIIGDYDIRYRRECKNVYNINNNNNNNNNNIKFIQEGICYKHTFIKLHPPV